MKTFTQVLNSFMLVLVFAAGVFFINDPVFTEMDKGAAPSYVSELKELFKCRGGAYTSAIVIEHGSNVPVVVNATKAFEDLEGGNNYKSVIAFCDRPA